MRVVTLCRIGADALRGSFADWTLPIAVKDLRSVAIAARDERRRSLVAHVVGDVVRYSIGLVRPIAGETLRRAELAAAWLARAQDVTGDGGLSYGYFPFRATPGWQPAYPETTGYTIPTLLEYAAVSGVDEYSGRAIQMARWALGCQMKSGAIYGGTVRPLDQGVAVAFNTGMVLLGFTAAYRHTRERSFAQSARNAAEFLVNDLGPDANFRSHGPFVEKNAIKTYTCLCAWPLWHVAEETGDERYADAALRMGDAALRQQQESGWFANNCLSTRLGAPWLHTIGYTLQGLLELGIASGVAKYVDATRRGVKALLPHCGRGFLHARWYADWQPAALSSCLTGSAQIAVVCYRLADHTGEARYRRAGDSVLNYLKALQPVAAEEPDLMGGLGGSFPLFGSYMRFGFPGWAVKFYLDALLWQERFRRRDQDRASHVATELRTVLVP